MTSYYNKFVKYFTKNKNALMQQKGGDRCTIKEFMNNENIENCENLSIVRGSCGDPTFINSQRNEGSKELKEIFEYIQALMTKPTDEEVELAIILGASNPKEITNKAKNGMTIYIEPTYMNGDGQVRIYDEYSNIQSTNGISTDDINIGGIYYIGAYFPLNFQTETNKYILDIIIKISTNDKIKVSVINKICGTCFRSFWYLVNNSDGKIAYVVNPLQSADPYQKNDPYKPDNLMLLDCFKDWEEVSLANLENQKYLNEFREIVLDFKKKTPLNI